MMCKVCNAAEATTTLRNVPNSACFPCADLVIRTLGAERVQQGATVAETAARYSSWRAGIGRPIALVDLDEAIFFWAGIANRDEGALNDLRTAMAIVQDLKKQIDDDSN